MSALPIPCMWSGVAFEPLKGFRKIAADQYGGGEVVTLAPWEDRSDATHNHEFAWIRTAWQTLPDSLSALYPSPQHLRKRALITAGFFTETIIDVGTNAGAIRTAAAVQALDAFAYVIVRGGFVVVRRAESQSRRSMGKERFQASKTAILEVISDMLGVEPQALNPESARKDGAAQTSPSPAAQRPVALNKRAEPVAAREVG